MEQLTQRVDQLEKTTRQIQQDLAVLTARSENFATKVDIENLRTEQAQMRHELMGEIGKLETRMDIKLERMDGKFEAKFDRIDLRFEKIDKKFDQIDKKFDQLNDRLTWSIMLPAIMAVVAWFIKVAVLKI